MYYEYFYVGRFIPYPDNPNYGVLLSPTRVGLTPAVSSNICMEDVVQAAESVVGRLDRDRIVEILEKNGIFEETNFLIVDSLTVTSLGRRIIEKLSSDLGYKILNKIGMFSSVDSI